MDTPPLPQAPAPARFSLGSVADVALRFLLIAAAAAVVLYIVAHLRLVVLTVIIAILLATIIAPPVAALRRRGLPATVATLIVMLIAALILAAVGAMIGPPVVEELDDLGNQVRSGADEVAAWLARGPFGLPPLDVDRLIDRAADELGGRSARIGQGIVTGALIVGELLAGFFLVLVLIFFFVKDGEQIWRWLVDLLPYRHRADALEAGRRSWTSLSKYVRGVALIATFDAVFIGAALALIGVPLVLPLAVLTFFGAFLPLIGAVSVGLIAILVALVSKGVVAALLVLVAITAIQQLEGDLLYPVVVGRAVKLHPVAILVGLTAGAVVAGVIGALLAVPAVAVAATVLDYYRDPLRGVTAAGVEPD